MSTTGSQADAAARPNQLSGRDVAYRQGYDAFWHGVFMRENPYGHGSPEYMLWNRGWIQAELEQCDE